MYKQCDCIETIYRQSLSSRTIIIARLGKLLRPNYLLKKDLPVKSIRFTTS